MKSLVPNGSWFGNMSRGIWQDVFIEYRSETYIEDVYINTSVRSRELKLDITVKNRGKCPTGKITADIFDFEDPLLNLSAMLSLEEHERKVITIKHKWGNAEYWSPEKPKLFKLVISIAKDGEIIDSLCKTFGFREVWLDGYKFILNGMLQMNLACL